MAVSFLSDPIVNSTITKALYNVSSGTAHDDIAILALLVLGGAGYLTRGTFWDKPDPYHHKWFERPQHSALNGRTNKKETRNIAEKLEQTERDVVIFWGSQSGTAEGFAHRLARDCRQRFRLETLVADLSDYDSETISLIPDTKFAIFIMSTYGEGDPSDNSADFCAWVQNERGMTPKNLRYMAFGLGNSNYKYYNKVIDNVTAALDGFGAVLMLPVGKADDANGATEEDFLSWKEGVFSVLRTNLGLPERDPEYEPCIQVVEDDSMTAIDLHMREPIQQRNNKKTATASSAIAALPVKETRELFSNPTADRSCVHMELDLTQTAQIKYKTGDHLAVWPVNPDGEVDRLLRVLGLAQKKETPLHILSLDPANTKVKVPTPTTALALFQHYLEICAPVSRETVLSLAQFAPNETVKSTLLNLGKNKEAYSTYLLSNHVTLGRLLETTNTSWPFLPLSFIIEALSPMTPRYYSISSSSIVSPRTASITAVVASTPLPKKPDQCIPGLATSYLSSFMQPSSTITSFVQTHPHFSASTNLNLYAQIRKSPFKLPTSSSTPIIMVAAGTGLAPFRAFLLERARLASLSTSTSHSSSVGETILFFGCRSPEEDFLYREEIEALQSHELKGRLTVITAFSRVPGQGKVYVQDRIQEHSQRVCDLLLDEGAVFYICGKADMAREVAGRLGGCVTERMGFKGKGDGELKGWTERMKRTRRWQEDVWG